MIPTGPPFGQAKIYFILLFGSAFAALRNITVDDAVSIGAVAPQYLPSVSWWNQGNNCSGCSAKPDPSQAYNATWHDTTFNPNSGVTQAIQFTFVGSALYIFFILANTVPQADTLTDVVFSLDGIPGGTFVHSPSTSTDYQYNVSVYVNESLTFGEHTMVIEPINSGNPVLILFDYFVYATDTNDTTAPGTQGTGAGQDTASIVGGIVGGVVGLVLLAASLLCYRRYKKRRRVRRLLPSQKGAVLGSLLSLDAVSPGPAHFASISSRVPHLEPHLCEPGPVYDGSPVTLRPPSPPISVDPPSTASLPNNNTALLEQVEMLRDEVSRLRCSQWHHQNTVALGRKDPLIGP